MMRCAVLATVWQQPQDIALQYLRKQKELDFTIDYPETCIPVTFLQEKFRPAEHSNNGGGLDVKSKHGATNKAKINSQWNGNLR